eukprot:6191753-Pleurochrysis_carterae.AAC.1
MHLTRPASVRESSSRSSIPYPEIPQAHERMLAAVRNCLSWYGDPPPGQKDRLLKRRHETDATPPRLEVIMDKGDEDSR